MIRKSDNKAILGVVRHEKQIIFLIFSLIVLSALVPMNSCIFYFIKKK